MAYIIIMYLLFANVLQETKLGTKEEVQMILQCKDFSFVLTL